ncbi:hypothetical protein NC653_036086 [Populus alba x Populus x berolinensis]|uniref:DC1 domain-containing protein n=1 Tax=Populus alba x Populus x berolinensis TaxID=444605 RepID=A0AAD6LIY7_9ROSI|nr:hypothetical protein NC653_036086 [Populus alba x Populus x berolinensis]
MEPSFRVVREIKHGEERIIEEIEHFSHQHNLILNDKVDDDLKCDGCMLPISTPFYSCASCNFFLDKTCSIELPRRKKWPYHENQLILFWNQGVHNLYYCYVCNQYFRGLSGCCVSGESKVFLKCAVCDFKLGMKCVTLPYKARHEYDDHPLFLTYINENDYQPSCIICEKYRDPKLWFYRCEECDFDAHPECALGKYPYVKLGEVRTYPKHPHPLALVDKTQDYAACDTCGEPCDDLALECTDSNCSFIPSSVKRSSFRSEGTDVMYVVSALMSDASNQ